MRRAKQLLLLGDERRIRQPLVVDRLGDAEVDDLWRRSAIDGGDQDIRRLEVAVKDAFLVRVLDRLADVDEQRTALPNVQVCSSQNAVMRRPPRTSSITKYGRPVSVAPAS